MDIEPSEPAAIERSGPTAVRDCGSCSLCCKVLGIDDLYGPDEHKPAQQWCKHCQIGKGCKIYDARPAPCREFQCMWVLGYAPEELRPDKTKCAFWVMSDDSVHLNIDTSRPRAASDKDVDRFIRFLIGRNYVVIMVCGDTHKLFVPPAREAEAKAMIANAEAAGLPGPVALQDVVVVPAGQRRL